MSNAKTVMSQAANTWAGPTYIEDVFSTYLYTGNGSTQTITNGIDLAGEGGLVWIKSRNNTTVHYLQDTERGANNVLTTTSTAAQSTLAINFSFTDSGFSQTNNNASFNQSYNYASWTWRKAPRWFDVVTYTGTGVAGRQIAHNLGVTPGCIIVKATSTTRSWYVYHRGYTTYTGQLESTAAFTANALGGVTDTDFTTGSYVPNWNESGVSYVAYLFAHDPLGPSGDGSDGLIACGSYTGNGSATGPVIDLGWEPQWVMIKGATSGAAYSWGMFDSMRGVTVGANDVYVEANTSTAEASPSEQLEFNASGFQLKTTGAARNASGQTYIYIAIRRGPMRQPTSGTEVFHQQYRTATTTEGTKVTTGFPVDSQIQSWTGSSTGKNFVVDRLRGVQTTPTNVATPYLKTHDTAAETTLTGLTEYWDNTGYGESNVWRTETGVVMYNFRRAPGFFDVVAYTGNGVAGRTVPHNLGVAPEMMIVKRRNGTNNWAVYHSATGATDVLFLNTTAATTSNSFYWNNTDPTADNFILNTGLNTSTYTYIAYLFATLPGVSKVGSFNSATDVNIDCGFTSGARFVLVKKTNDIGSWYVVDSVRGIVSSLEPVLELNSTGAEFSSDLIDPYAPGFAVGSNLQNTGTYIYYAIA